MCLMKRMTEFGLMKIFDQHGVDPLFSPNSPETRESLIPRVHCAPSHLIALSRLGGDFLFFSGYSTSAE